MKLFIRWHTKGLCSHQTVLTGRSLQQAPREHLKLMALELEWSTLGLCQQGIWRPQILLHVHLIWVWNVDMIHRVAFFFLTLFSLYTLLRSVKISHLLWWLRPRTPLGAQYRPIPASTVHTQEPDHPPAPTAMSPPPLGLAQTRSLAQAHTRDTLRVQHTHGQRF